MIPQFEIILTQAVGELATGVYNTVREHSQKKPFVVYQKISDNRQHNISFCEDPRQAVIQVDIYSHNYDKALSDLQTAVESITGTYSGKIQAIFQERQTESYEQDEETHNISTDFLIIYTTTEQ